MNNFIVLLILVPTLFLLTNADFETDYMYIKMCNNTSPISVKTMNEVLINKKLSKTESTSFKCFLHCLFMQYKWMDEDGGFELHEMRATLEESGSIEGPLLEYVMYTCTAIHSVDKCERAYIFTECFWKKSSEENAEEDKYFYSIDDKKKK